MNRPEETTWRQLRGLLMDEASVETVRPEVIGAARSGGVLALLAERCSGVAEACAEELAREAVAQMHLTLASREIGALLKEAGVTRAALLKGNATGLLLYASPHLRPVVDVDILVGAEDFQRTLQVLREGGWEDAVPSLSAAAFGKQPFEWCFDRSFGDVQLQCDVHQRLVSSDTVQVNHASILDRAESHPESPLLLCHPEDLFLGGVLHTAKDSFDVPLKSWLDLSLLSAHPRVSLERCAERAAQWSMGNITWACLEVLRRWEMAQIPETLIEDLRPAAPVARLLEMLLSGEGARAPRWPRHRRWGYFFPGAMMGDGPGGAARWMRWRARSLLRAERRRWTI